jgi:PleD family two-component response regulator
MAAINALAIPHENSPIATVITVSIGVATVMPSATDSQHDLLALVDGCLYEAKNSGKNQINFQVSV